ncbi:SseB family protein [Planococcus sp. APC 4015]|nr:SseB family protein [Planococcus sp. APC 4015]
MALFSRRPQPTPDEPDAPSEPVTPDVPVAEPPAEATASVGISVSSFQGLGSGPAQAAPAPAAPAAPPVLETVPGLRDNVVLREALAGMPENPSPQQLLDLSRQVLQGHLFLRVKGDARALIAEGKELPLAVAAIGDRRFALAYSSGAALQASIRADGDATTSALGQPSITVLRHVRDGALEGLIIDPASAPARAILPRALIERMLSAGDETLAVKTLLSQGRTEAIPAAVADALTRAPLWVAVNNPVEGAPAGIAESRSQDGGRYLELFTHPLEIAAMARADRAAPITGAQLATALRADPGISGVLIDPRGPWIRLNREELAPVLALAD